MKLQGLGIVPVFWLVSKFLSIIYPEVIVTSFLYSVSYRAHNSAIVAVFVSGVSVAQDRGRHKAVIHHTATSKQVWWCASSLFP